MPQDRSPPWTRDELILALDVYFSGIAHSPKEPKIAELSRLLKSLPFHGEEKKAANFRSANSVRMKLDNFLSLDPSYDGVGLERIAKEDGRVWNEFVDKKSDLKAIALTIREHAKRPQTLEGSGNLELTYAEAPEGRILTQIHVVRERNRRLVKAKKERVFEKTGMLECEACGFDFAKKYGEERGRGFIECHHNKPLHSLKPGDRTRLDDLSLLCSNCHRMIHVKQPWLELEELILLLDAMSEI